MFFLENRRKRESGDERVILAAKQRSHVARSNSAKGEERLLVPLPRPIHHPSRPKDVLASERTLWRDRPRCGVECEGYMIGCYEAASCEGECNVDRIKGGVGGWRARSSKQTSRARGCEPRFVQRAAQAREGQRFTCVSIDARSTRDLLYLLEIARGSAGFHGGKGEICCRKRTSS